MENLKISGIDESISFDVNTSEEQQFCFTKDVTCFTTETFIISITCNAISNKWVNVYVDIENKCVSAYSNHDTDIRIYNRSKFYVFNQRTKEFIELKQM